MLALAAELSGSTLVVSIAILGTFGAFCFTVMKLFAREQRRALYLAFLNNVSKTAISSERPDTMLAEIGAEIRKSFQFDHIGIGLLEYATKEIEMKVEAGCAADLLGKRIPLGTGIVGRAARGGEMVLLQDLSHAASPGTLLPDARSVLCVPIAYGDTALGVLNVESRTPKAFGDSEALILRTLADLLATALHNAFVFQKLQQQAITDGLTGIKTRRYFLESLQAEWKRASRSGHAFSVVMMDLDRFSEINDALGHLEGDLVLARVGRLLEQKCRQSNVVARYGGDEFVILMPETALEQAQVLGERLRQWIAADPVFSDRHISASFGVASFPQHGASAEEIIRVADAGIYASKHNGGNQVCTADAATAESAHRQMMTAFIEGFLQREHTGPELAEELVRTLRRLSAAIENPAAGKIALREAVMTLSRAAETRELHTLGHGDAVAHLAEQMGRALHLDESELRELTFAARVHDVGKLLIAERILNKTDALTEDEFYLVKQHCTLGAEIVSAVPNSASAQLMIRHHHERWDGEGYPDGLKQNEIPLGARILAVADAYANMTADRPYAAARQGGQAAAELQRVSGRQLDPKLVEVFLAQMVGEKAAEAGAS
jgi:diguanylate cyclase (GGDEF)-like protein